MEKTEKKFWTYIDRKINGKQIDRHMFNNSEMEIIKDVAKRNKIYHLIEEDFLKPTFEEKLLYNANLLMYNNSLYFTNKVLKEFSANNIDYVIYKGAINNLILFNSFIREFTDIDLLIKATDFEKAWKILYDNGYIDRDDEGNEKDIYKYKKLSDGGQFVKNNNDHILRIDLHTSVPFLGGFSVDVLSSHINLLYSNMYFKIPDRTFYFLIMIINLYDNFCTRYGILNYYCFNDIYESILFYKKYSHEINLNQIIKIFNEYKKTDIINYVFSVLNLFSPHLIKNDFLMKCCMNDNNSSQDTNSDLIYLKLDIKSCMFSNKNRLISYNNNIRLNKPDYYYPTILNPPVIVEKIEDVDNCFCIENYYKMQSTNSNFNENINFNVAQTDDYFIVFFNNFSVLTNHIFELCLFNDDYDSEILNERFTFDIVDGIVKNVQEPVLIKNYNDKVAFLIPFSILKVYEDRYVLLSFIFRKKYSGTLNQVILGKGWYTTPVKYYLK